MPDIDTTGSSKVEVKPFGPVHLKVTPGVVVVVLSVTEGLAQVIVSVVTDKSGTVGSCVTTVVSELVQPLAKFVTTKMYVPGLLTAGFCCVETNPPGPVQR